MVGALNSKHVIHHYDDREHGKSNRIANGLDYGNRTIRNIRIRLKGDHDHHGHSGHHRVNRPVDKEHNRYGGSIRPHNREHARILRNLIDSHGGDPRNITHEEKDLANMAAHRNLGALDKLSGEGSISPDTANAVMREAGGEYPYSGMGMDPRASPEPQTSAGDAALAALQGIMAPSPSPSAAARGSGLSEMVSAVASGSPAPADLESPPDLMNPNGTYKTPRGVATGRTNKEQAAINALSMNEKPIDDGISGGAYSELLGFGHSPSVARGVADEIRDANASKALRFKKIQDLSQPAISPLYVSQADLAHMTNAKDTVPDSVKIPFMRGIFEDHFAATGSPERAEFEANQGGLLVDEYNAGLSEGLSPSVAYGKAMNAVQNEYRHAQRAAAITGGGQRVARTAADKAAIEHAAMEEMISTPPELRPKLIEKKIEASNAKKMDRARELNDDLVEAHVKEPIVRAQQKLQQAAALKDAASMEGIMNPVVQEKILRDIAAASAEDSEKARGNLEHTRAQVGPNRHKTSALNLLSKVNTEKAIDGINRENEERQKEVAKMQKEANENNAVKAAEEKLAKAKENQIIKTHGDRAFAKVYDRTNGDPIQANEARERAERGAKYRLDHEKEMRKAQVMKMIGPIGVDSEAIQEAADHIATAHAGLNPVGPTLKDISDKYEEEMKHQMNTEALIRETATSNLQVKEIIPPTTSKIGIIDGKMKLPLKGFSGEEAKTEQEALVQSRQKNRRNQVRNRVVGVPVESGLNVIETDEGFTHISEAAKSLNVNKGTIFYPENAKGLMEKQNIDTSALEHRFNTGERPDLDKGVGYYRADASGFKLPLPSPSDPVPASVMTNGEKTLNIEHASGMQIESGDLIETPWNEFVKEVRPTINGIQLQEDEVAAASEMKARVDNEKRARNLEGITTEVYTNPDGSKFVEVSPPYGVPELMTINDAVESLNSVGSSSVSAVSEEPKKQSPDIPLDMATTATDKGSEDGFINTVLAGAEGTSRGASVDKNNALNGQVNEDKAAIANLAHKEAIKPYLSPEKTPEATIRNSIVNKSEIYAARMGIPAQSFLKMVSQIPNDTIKEMINYNQAPANARKDVTETQFYSQIAGILPAGPNGGKGVNTNSVIETVFNNVAAVTHQPNTVGGEILERMTVPNLKAIEQVEIKKTPTGVTETSISVPNQPGSTQILGQIRIQGNPKASLPGDNRTTPSAPKGAPQQPTINNTPNVPSSQNNPLKPGVPIPNNTGPVQMRPSAPVSRSQPDHTIRGKTYTFSNPGAAAYPAMVGTAPQMSSGFTGRVSG